jgi:hypothetical protein
MIMCGLYVMEGRGQSSRFSTHLNPHSLEELGGITAPEPKERNFSSASSMFADSPNTWAIDGGRPRFKLVAYARDADEVDDVVDDEESRRSARDARRSSFSRCRSAAATSESRIRSRPASGVGVRASGMTQSE